MNEKKYNLKFYLNDGEYTCTVARGITFNEIFSEILGNIKFRYPDWTWDEQRWLDASIHEDGCTYIRIRGVGDVWKGQTYYIVEEA